MTKTTSTYGLSFANGPRVSIYTLLTLAQNAGLSQQVARMEALIHNGTRYSYEDFDILSAVAADLHRAGISCTKEGGR